MEREGERQKERGNVRATIIDVNALIEGLLLSYPECPAREKAYLVSELNALQQLYFKKTFPEYAIAEVPLNSFFCIDLTEIQPEQGCALDASDIEAVFVGDEEVALLPPLSYLRESGDCGTFFGKYLQMKFERHPEALSASILYRCRPSDVVIANGVCSGAVCIPEKHLPAVYARLRECICRLVGENEEADRWAASYNAWIDVIDREQTALDAYGGKAL